MTGQGNVTDVETEALLVNARRRYEDSYAYHAIRNYLMEVGDVPNWAWGELPWSDQWKTGWAHDIDHRITDAGQMRDHMARTGGTLIQVAADYVETDVEISLTFTTGQLGEELRPILANDDTTPFFDYYTRDVTDVSTTPGGQVPEPIFPERATPAYPSPDRAPYLPIPLPAENERFQQLRDETRPHVVSTDRPPRFVGGTPQGSAVEVEQPPEHTFISGEDDGLERFVQQYGEILMNIELEARSVDPGIARPWTDLIGPAWLSSPSVIRNRARLIGSVEASYRDLQRNFDAETRSFANYWDSPGASGAYFAHAGTLGDYLEDIRAVAKETADDCQQAAQVLQELRNEYAEIGYDRIEIMRQRYYEHLYGYANAIAAVEGCFSRGGRVSAFVNVVKEFNEAAQRKLDHADDEARAHLRGERVAVSGGPGFGHPSEPFPGDSVGGYGAWNDGTQWRPATDGG